MSSEQSITEQKSDKNGGRKTSYRDVLVIWERQELLDSLCIQMVT